MRQLRESDPECQRWILVPEAAPLLFEAGLSARDKAFQSAVVRLQIALEDGCDLAAPSGAALVCDRGALDPLAYWLTFGWKEAEFFACTGFSRRELLARYTGILHLQTTALGAEALYRHWPDAHRPETARQAAEIDCFCLHAWNGHPRHIVLENGYGGWKQKEQQARHALHGWAGKQIKLQPVG